MMRYRDAHGRFRHPTDEERWPDPDVRALRQRTRERYAMTRRYVLAALKQSLKDVEYFSGKIWGPVGR